MAHTHSHAESTGNETVHHEERDIDIAAIFKFVFYLTAVTLATHLYVWLLMGRLNQTIDESQVIQYPLAVAQGERLPPAPRLQTSPRGDLQQLRETWRTGLEGYSWVDRSSGAVRLPIDEGMKRALNAGMPTRSASTPPAAAAAAEPAAPAPAGRAQATSGSAETK